MARLTIEQVKAPDFSASSEMLARANQSFNTGIDSAKGILDKYNTGQQAKGDQALVGALAGLNSEEDLANFLQTTDLASMNISDTMRANILGARADILGNNATRQSTANAFDANSRANAGEGRVAAEYADGVAARDELRGLTGAYVRSLEEGQSTGSSGVVAGVDLGAVERNYNLPSGYMGTMAQIESGGDPNAQNNNSSAGGLFQQIDSNAEAYGVTNRFDPAQSADGAARFAVDNANTLRGVLGRDPTGGELYLAHQQGPGGARALLSNPNARAVDVVGAEAVQLNGGHPDMTAGEFANLWIDKFNRIQGNGGGGTSTQPVTSVGTGGPAAQAFRDALAASVYMTPDAAANLLQTNLDNQLAGDERITAAETLRQTTLGQEAQLAAITDPNNITTGDVQRDLADTAGLSAGSILRIAGADYGAYGEIIAPPVAANPEATAAAELAAAAAARDNELDPTIQAFEEAAAFDANESGVGAALTANLGDAATGVLDPANVDRALSQFAESNGITVGEAAVVFNSVAQGNADQLAAQIQASTDTEMYLNLSSIADRMFGESARSSYEDGRLSDVRDAAQRDSIQANILVAKTEAAKHPAGSTERAAAEENVRLLEVGSIATNQPQKTRAQTAKYLGIEPSQLSALTSEDKAAAENAIRSNPDLSIEQKMLLIMGLRL